ncbi:hypothetical protein CDD81_652 [Ophiocordyceps australis]|uniref:Uncharacterized protein n=1 Tax=Ophiocordyceps australis TaxID=1399860 RepID=A0A2C5XFZ6_9HYPO|nr:hypothetical protein CDD81_652 [Ophiocordyceps australis]
MSPTGGTDASMVSFMAPATEITASQGGFTCLSNGKLQAAGAVATLFNANCITVLDANRLEHLAGRAVQLGVDQVPLPA